MTLAEIIRWLEDDTVDRVVIFDIDYVVDVVGPQILPHPGPSHIPTVFTKRVSTTGYVTKPSDDPPNTGYDSCVKEVPRYERSIDRQTFGGRGTMSVGSLTIDNQEATYDDFLGLACDGSEVRCYVGDRSWARADFIHLFTAITERVDAPDTNTIVIQLKDSLSLLNASMALDFIGGTDANQERAKPINFGLCHEVECLLEDHTTLLYRYGVAGSALAVRDRALAVAYTDNFDGTLNLSASPAGIITADVLTLCGPGTSYRASDIIEQIAADYLLRADYPAKFYGNITPSTYPATSSLYGEGDLELGVRVEEKTNSLDVLDKICFSAITFYTFTRDAKFAYGRIHPNIISNSVAPHIVLTADDLKSDVKIEHADPQYWTWYFFYNKNWHVMSQGDFAGAVTTDDQAKFAAKGIYASYKSIRPGIDPLAFPGYSDDAQSYHKTMSVSPETETVLSISDTDDAVDPDHPLGVRWFRRMNSIHFPWMEFVTITVGLKAFYLELGNIVAFDFPRYGFDTVNPVTGVRGARFQLVGIDLQLTDNQVELVLFRNRDAEVAPPNVHKGDGLVEGTSLVLAVSRIGHSGAGSSAGVATVSGVGHTNIVAGAGSSSGSATVSGVGSTVGGGAATAYDITTDGNTYDSPVGTAAQLPGYPLAFDVVVSLNGTGVAAWGFPGWSVLAYDGVSTPTNSVTVTETGRDSTSITFHVVAANFADLYGWAIVFDGTQTVNALTPSYLPPLTNGIWLFPIPASADIVDQATINPTPFLFNPGSPSMLIVPSLPSNHQFIPVGEAGLVTIGVTLTVQDGGTGAAAPLMNAVSTDPADGFTASFDPFFSSAGYEWEFDLALNGAVVVFGPLRLKDMNL